MIRSGRGVRIYVCQQATDMRRSHDGLARMSREVIRRDPLSGHLFVFCNRRRDRVKILYWDGDGLALWYKRLEQGTYRVPKDTEISMALLEAMLEGIEYEGLRHGRRYQLK